MKKTLLTLSFLFSIQCIVAQAYVPFPTSNASWKESIECSTFDISIVKDTIINTKTYHTLVAHEKRLHIVGNPGNCHPLGSFTMFYNIYLGAFRNDSLNKKVWFVPPQSSTEVLLYDFNLQVGDTLPISHKYNPTIYFNHDTMTVKSIDSINLRGIWRKRYKLSDCKYFSFSRDTIFLIEGIGSTQSLLLPYSDCPMGRIGGILCTKEFGMTVFPDSSYQCNVIVGLDALENQGKAIDIRPNPTNGLISISENEQIDFIQLYNIRGQLIEEMKANTSSETLIHIEGSPGIYLLRLKMKDESVNTTKVIKQ